MKTVHVNVTAEHIERGERLLCKTCPIALAMLEAGARDVRVGWTRTKARVDDADALQCAAMPAEARRFVADFDDGKDVEPLSFDLEFSP